MKYTPTDLAGVMIVDIEPDRDDRGFFTRSFLFLLIQQPGNDFACCANEYLL